MVKSSKYLGVQLKNMLEWSTNREAIYIMGLIWLHFLRRLRSFNAHNKMLCMFYQSVVASTILLLWCTRVWTSEERCQQTEYTH